MPRIKLHVAQWGYKEILLSLRLFVTGQSILGNYQGKLSHFLSEAYNLNHATFLNSARAGIYFSLLAMKEKKIDANEVIIPQYICQSVIDIIESAGLKVVKAKVGEDLLLDISSVEASICQQTLAVLMVHMYGKIADIDTLSSLCKKKNVFLIDDAAQTAGEYHEGKMLGTFGDSGVISFSQSKTITTGVKASGGILLCNNKNLQPRITQLTSNLEQSVSRLPAFVHFVMYFLLQGVWRKLDYYISRISTKLKNKRKDYYSPITNISNLDAAIALLQYKKLTENKKNIINSLVYYKKLIGEFKSISAPQLCLENSFLTRLVLRSHVIAPDNLATYLNQRGIITRFAYQSGSKPYNGSPDSGLLEIPLVGVSIDEINFIVSTIVEAEKELA